MPPKKAAWFQMLLSFFSKPIIHAEHLLNLLFPTWSIPICLNPSPKFQHHLICLNKHKNYINRVLVYKFCYDPVLQFKRPPNKPSYHPCLGMLMPYKHGKQNTKFSLYFGVCGYHGINLKWQSSIFCSSPWHKVTSPCHLHYICCSSTGNDRFREIQ